MQFLIQCCILYIILTPIQFLYCFLHFFYLTICCILYCKRKSQTFQRLAYLTDLPVVYLIHSKHHRHRLRKTFLEFAGNIISRSLLRRNYSCHIHDTDCLPHRITAYIQPFCDIPLRRQFLPRTKFSIQNLLFKVINYTFISLLLSLHHIPLSLYNDTIS